ncbi:MAG: S-ribosylhomocysteine lyase [Gemmiger sp.]|nr:S-ribosylhomocysteine lyase [Gemmiger sp.]
MERIASFCVDHTTLQPGVYLSRQDGDVMTWDVRMKQPNAGQYLSPACAHTLEHLFATYARNSDFSGGVIYVGPMGCLTGFYLLTKGLTNAQVLSLIQQAFGWMASYEGEIPGASATECGNYLMMDPIAARCEAAAMLPVLAALTPEALHYNTASSGK